MLKKIMFVSSEVFPFAATGGLGDVTGSLPKAVKGQMKQQAEISVVMPMYSKISDEYRSKMTYLKYFFVTLGWRKQYCGIFRLEKDGVVYYFLDNEYYFKRENLYGEYDDGERFAFFSKAVVEMMAQLDYYPDILHAHDWQTALCVVYLKTQFKNIEKYKDIKTLFTIHNIEYQGKFDFSILYDVFDLNYEYSKILEYDGCVNLMKGAVVLCDRLTTVSPMYSKEIKYPEYSHGLHYILKDNSYKLCGILNGIDYDYYNPAKDVQIASEFDEEHLHKKAECKIALQKELSLEEGRDVPVIAVISRLAQHKGIDLVQRIMEEVVQNNDVQLVVLGKGEKEYEDYFSYLDAKYHNKVRSLILYDKDLSKRIYAACDIFLMPSKSEPCGLAQMMASRYGAVPVTREVGGLYDSIKGYYEKDGEIFGNGFTFKNYSEYELKDRIYAALNLYSDKEKWTSLVKKVMKTDFSWEKSAKEYVKLYCEL